MMGKSDPFTSSEIDLIMNMMKDENSSILTQDMFKRLQPILRVKNKIAFARLTTFSKINAKIGYAFEEYDWENHSKKALVQIRCQHCSAEYVTTACQLRRRKYYKIQAYSRCYQKHHARDEAWSERNAASQKIAQNRPATLEKHRANSAKLWVGEHGQKMRDAHLKSVSRQSYKDNMASIMKEKWKTDEVYRDKVSGKGRFKHVGISETGIVYHSKLELAFLMRCRDRNEQVERCNFAISYVNPIEQTTHDYYPDFILGGKTIIEIKGQRWADASPEIFKAKCDALECHCHEHGLQFQIIFDKELKMYGKEASEYHENQKKDFQKI